jgi:TonB family protein
MRIVISILVVAAVVDTCCAQDSAKRPIRIDKPIGLYTPHPNLSEQARRLSGSGVCVVYLRPDGTVSRAEMAPSTGQPLLDKEFIATFLTWRFIPGSAKKVKIPITYISRPTATRRTFYLSRDFNPLATITARTQRPSLILFSLGL